MRALEPTLEPGRVYRTKEFGRWARNPFALATRLEREGKLTHLGYGLYHHPKQGPWGPRPPKTEELIRAFLVGRPFLVTGSMMWNRLGLGTTQRSMVPTIYNTHRSGLFTLNGLKLEFKRSRFPALATPEWFAVDFLNNLDVVVDAEPERNLAALGRLFKSNEMDRATFAAALAEYGTRTTKNLVAAHGVLTEPEPRRLRPRR